MQRGSHPPCTKFPDNILYNGPKFSISKVFLEYTINFEIHFKNLFAASTYLFLPFTIAIDVKSLTIINQVMICKLKTDKAYRFT